MKIITNNHPRDILFWHELTDKEKEIHDWVLSNDNNPDEFSFFRYKDWVYCLSDFLYYGKGSMMGKIPECFNDWDSYMSDSFFSGILIKYPYDDFIEEYDYEHIIVGWYYS